MNYKLKQNINNNYSVIEQIFINRGFELSNIQHYLNTTDDDILNPLLLDNIELAAKTLIKHIKENNQMFICVDPDCDGMTSAAIFINYLYKLFPSYVINKVKYGLPKGKQHGVNVNNIPLGTSLVVAIDSSSSSFEETKELKNKNIEVIVLDHHESEHVDENAIIVNNQLCDYPTKSLSGAGIAFKFCSYLDSLLSEDKRYADELLDLAALGMIADMVSLKDFETRRIITKGLAAPKNIFLSAMIDKNSYSLGSDLTPMGVAFYIAPYVNATIRSGTQKEKMILFEAMLDHKAHNKVPSTKRGCAGQEEFLVHQAVRNCTNIKNRQTKSRDKNYEIVKEIIETQNLLNNKILLITLPKIYNMDKNLTGLVANQIMAEYQRPTLILNETENTWEGSGRGYKLSSFKDFLNENPYVNWATGHANAMGCSISKENLQNFIENSNELLRDMDFTPCPEVDFVYDGYNFVPNDILQIAQLKQYWGQEIPEPLVVINNVKVTKDNIVLMSPDKNPTLKINLPNGIEIIKFKSSKEEYEALKPIDTGALTLTVLGTCDANTWNGVTTGQILINDYEITKEIKYYF